MKISTAKYTLLAAVMVLAACKRDGEDDFAAEQQQPGESNMTFAASFEHPLSKAALHIDGDSPATATAIQTYFLKDDAISVFDGVANNKFSTADNGATASFSGMAKASATGYMALFPYNSAAKINDDGSIATTVPTKQSFKSEAATSVNSALEGIVAIAQANLGDMSFTLKNATAIIRITTQGEISSSIKVESSKPIAGDFSVKFDNYGDPAASGATSYTVELTDAPHGGYISILPVEAADFKVTYTTKDGTPKEAYFQNVTAKRSEILNFGDIDQLLTITYDVSGIPGATAKNKCIRPGSDLILPNSIGEGVTFKSWLDKDGNERNKGTKITNVTEALTFVALSENEKVLVFNFNNDENGNVTTEVKQFKKGENVTMPSNAIAPEGKHLIGWDFSLTPGDNTEYQPGQTADVWSKITNTTRVIYAHYALNDVKVTLDANGGKFADNSTTKSVIHKWGVAPEIPEDQPEREGYWFKAWENIDGIDLKNDVTVKAVWGNFYKITFHDFDGTALTQYAQTFNDGETTTLRNDIKLGNNIKSWNTKQNGEGTDYTPGLEYTFTGNIDLYPVKSNDQPSSIDPWKIKEF